MIFKGKSIQSVADATIYPFLNDSLQSEDETVVRETLNYIKILADLGVERKYFLGLQKLLYHKKNIVARNSLDILRKMSTVVAKKEVEVNTDVWKSMYPFLCNQALSTSVVAIESLKILDVLVDYGIVGDYKNLQKALLHKSNNVAHLTFDVLRKIVGLSTESRTGNVKIEEKITTKESYYTKYPQIKINYDAIKKLKNDSKSKNEVLKGITNQIQKVNDIDAKINALDNELKKFLGYEKVSNEIISNLTSLENQRNELQDELDKTHADFKKEQDTLNIDKSKSNNLLYIGIIIFLIGVFGARLINYLFIICILIGIILIILHLIKSKTNNMVANQTRIEQFESTIHEKETSIEKLSRQIESYYSSLPTNNLKELSENFEIYSKKAQKKADLVSQKDILIGKNQVDELEKKRHELLIETGKIDARLKELGELNLSAEEQIKLQELSVLKK
ncbi:MAG: hypothetical protein ABOK23_11900 [Candidatus Methanoperedens sp.]|nr:hypothetical protein [Candidatus Methanoperedens sp.]MCZ7395249.1 hypothetical protein [Candidatus Methanoperedens sp.]